MEKIEKFLDKYFWLVIVTLSIPAFWALLVPGFYGASDDIHIAWLYEMHQTILAGKIPPRFVPDLSFGFGYPLFNFVFPLPFYIAETFYLMGANLVDSIKTVFLLTIPISGIFMYLFLRQFVGNWLSLAGALVYIYTPYRAVDIYVRGAIGEIVSFVFLPIILLSFVKLSQDKEKSPFTLKWIGVGALSLATLVLSHNIIAYMFLPFVFLFALLRLFSLGKDTKRVLLNFGLSFILALLISSYFWVPAILESRLFKYSTVFNFADHFPTIRQLVTSYWGYGASVPGPDDGMSFFLGMANILIILLGVISFIFYFKKYSKDEKTILIWAFISMGISIFLMNYRSTYFWQSIPLLPYFQFPWRFLIMTTFCVPVLIISLKYFKFNKIILVGIIFVSLITTSTYFRPQDFLERKDNYYINRYIPTPLASTEYLTTQEEYLRLPIFTTRRPTKNYPLVLFNQGKVKKITRINALDTTIEVESTNGGILNYNKYYFPGWRATLDGSATLLMPGNPFGQIIVWIPSGEHKVKINFEETAQKMILDWISVLSLLFALALVLKINLFKFAKSGKIRSGD